MPQRKVLGDHATHRDAHQVNGAAIQVSDQALHRPHHHLEAGRGIEPAEQAVTRHVDGDDIVITPEIIDLRAPPREVQPDRMQEHDRAAAFRARPHKVQLSHTVDPGCRHGRSSMVPRRARRTDITLRHVV